MYPECLQPGFCVAGHLWQPVAREWQPVGWESCSLEPECPAACGTGVLWHSSGSLWQSGAGVLASLESSPSCMPASWSLGVRQPVAREWQPAAREWQPVATCGTGVLALLERVYILDACSQEAGGETSSVEVARMAKVKTEMLIMMIRMTIRRNCHMLKLGALGRLQFLQFLPVHFLPFVQGCDRPLGNDSLMTHLVEGCVCVCVFVHPVR